MDLYTVTYPEYNVTQTLVLISHSIYLEYKFIRDAEAKNIQETKENEKRAKSWLKATTGGQEYFTDQSPIYESISSGILQCNGTHQIIITKLTT